MILKTQENESSDKKQPTFEKIFLEDPLYTKYSIYDFEVDEIINILFYFQNSNYFNKYKTIDNYFKVCKKNTTFISEYSDSFKVKELFAQLSENSNDKSKFNIINFFSTYNTIERVFKCSRSEENEHNLHFIFRIENSVLIKIGQSPSIADLINIDIKKYRKFNEEIYKELNTAIGLSAHGLGIAPYVYLRRVIENHILKPKLEELVQNGKICNDDIFKSDFKNKLKLAKDSLPEFLINNPNIYSILSKGIHSLDENECKKIFPILKQSIMIILDQEIEKSEREKNNKILANQLNKFN